MPAIQYPDVPAALAAMGPAINRVVYHRGDATGDISHVLAAMAKNPALGVIVMDGHGTAPGGLDRVANIMVDHFRMSQERVKFVSTGGFVPKPRKVGQRINVAGREFTMFPLTKSTNFIRDGLALVAANPHVHVPVPSQLTGSGSVTANQEVNLILFFRDRLAPVDASDVALVDDLKSAVHADPRLPMVIGDPWQVVVPTSMQVLDDALLAAVLRSPA